MAEEEQILWRGLTSAGIPTQLHRHMLAVEGIVGLDGRSAQRPA